MGAGAEETHLGNVEEVLLYGIFVLFGLSEVNQLEHRDELMFTIGGACDVPYHYWLNG